MKCPTDSATLVMSERSGVEIDYCPECRGVWLDRGELDKIIDRAEAEFASRMPAAAPVAPVAYVAPAAPVAPQAPPAQQYDPRFGAPVQQQGYDNRGYDNRGSDNRSGYRPKKKDSWLSELFD